MSNSSGQICISEKYEPGQMCSFLRFLELEQKSASMKLALEKVDWKWTALSMVVTSEVKNGMVEGGQ